MWKSLELICKTVFLYRLWKRIFILVYREDSNGKDAGAAYVYSRGDGSSSLQQLQRLAPSTAIAFDHYGEALGLDPNLNMYIGAHRTTMLPNLAGKI